MTKYRAKRKDNHEWVKGDLIADKFISPTGGKGNILGVIDETPDEYGEKKMIISVVEIIPETIGRFLEAEDKNGVELYGGDITVDKYGHEYTFDNVGSGVGVSKQGYSVRCDVYKGNRDLISTEHLIIKDIHQNNDVLGVVEN